MPTRISSPRMSSTLRKPADATAANGTRRLRMSFVEGDTRLRRGTREFRPTATEHEAPTARKYDCAIFEYESGVDLLAFALFMATLRDWFVICQRMVPAFCVAQ
ncbi:hypothetical protein RRF57_013234 [Xylaria bambusicola]|uniref:Uncharacterized protein n=1 Tax=Xylaria bambusicola TaxID=326684 RepID=A0AAN7Z560_9PEZI